MEERVENATTMKKTRVEDRISLPCQAEFQKHPEVGLAGMGGGADSKKRKS